MADQVTGVWQGPFDGLLPNGQTVRPGETALISRRDLESGHWKKSTAKPENAKAGSDES